MGVLSGSWWFLVVLGGLRQLLSILSKYCQLWTIHDISCQFLSVLISSWWLLVIVKRFLEVLGVPWWFLVVLVVPGDSCWFLWFLLILGGFWWFFVVLGVSWRFCIILVSSC